MAKAQVKSSIIAGDGQTITGLSHGGGTITEVWLDSKRLYSLPKQKATVYHVARQWTLSIPAWVDNVTVFITGGNGGGQAGNGALASRNGEAGKFVGAYIDNAPIPPDKRGGTIDLTIGAGGRGGQADSEPGGQGEPSTIKITDGSGTVLIQKTVEGGLGGNTIGGTQQRTDPQWEFSTLRPGIEGTTLKSLNRPGAGGNGGVFGNYGKGGNGGPGYARIIFTRGVDPGEIA